VRATGATVREYGEITFIFQAFTFKMTADFELIFDKGYLIKLN